MFLLQSTLKMITWIAGAYTFRDAFAKLSNHLLNSTTHLQKSSLLWGGGGGVIFTLRAAMPFTNLTIFTNLSTTMESVSQDVCRVEDNQLELTLRALNMKSYSDPIRSTRVVSF